MTAPASRAFEAAPTPAAACGLAAGRALLDGLAGHAVGPDSALVRSLADDATLAALDEAGEDAPAAVAARFRVARAHAETLPERLQRALGADRATVLLPDGSALDRAQAERLLAHKEHERVYVPLRRALAATDGAHLRPHDDRSRFLGACGDERLSPRVQVQRAARRAQLAAFLAGTVELRKEAIGALEAIGRTAIDGPDALHRALDLPAPRDDGAFSEQALTTIGRLLRERLPDDAMPLKRVQAPRGLAGHVVVGVDAVRLLVAPTLRAARHLALGRGLGRALVEAARSPASLRPDADALDGAEPAGLIGAAIGLAAVDVAARRHAGFSHTAAVDAARIARLTAFLDARVACAVALCESDDVGELRERLHAALGADLGIDACHRLRQPPWPDGRPPLSTTQHALAQAEAHLSSAALWDAWRCALDEDFAFRGSWYALDELAHERLATWTNDAPTGDAPTRGAPTSDAPRRTTAEKEKPAAATAASSALCSDASTGWRTFLGELL